MEEIEEGNSVLISKIISGVVLFSVSTLCGILPFKLAKFFKWEDQTEKDKKPSVMVNMLLCFGGGVLIATTFLHLLPDISMTIDLLKEEGLIPNLGFSLPEFLMMIGFFLIYLLEEIVHNYLHRYQHKKKKEVKDKNALTDTYNKSMDKTVVVPQSTNQGHGHSHIIPLPHSEEEDMLGNYLREKKLMNRK
jgi:zinc transporter ZupT